MAVSKRRPIAGGLVSWGLVALLLALLSFLATLQVRWIGELSSAERDRTRRQLERGASEMASDLDRELGRLFLFFQPARVPPRDLEEMLASRLEAWAGRAEEPRLVARLVLAEVGVADEAEAARCLTPPADRFEDCAWPAEILGEDGLSVDPRGRRRGRFRADSRRAAPAVLRDAPPALVVPAGPIRGPVPRGAFGREPSARGPIADGRRLLVLELDRGVLVEELLPALALRHLGRDRGLEHFVTVRRKRDGSTVFRAGPEGEVSAGAVVEVTADLFGLRPRREADQVDGVRARPGGAAPFRDPEDARPSPPLEAAGLGAGGPLWTLEIAHSAGSLEAAVVRTRRRSLTVSFAVLLLLAASSVLLVINTRRAQRLAARQLEFVAGVSHELLTPLAAMRSAAQNLADGVVTEGDRVARYGSLIDREGERLSNLVGQVLALSGLEIGGKRGELQPMAAGALIDEALDDHRAAIEAAGLEVEVEVAPDLAPLLGDPLALRRALGNLIANAVKYGGDGGWLRVSARPDGVGERIEIAVEDRGPGIDPRDLPHLFERFVRGRGLAASHIPGSGLGLALVRRIAEDHGGGVAVEPRDAPGARFVLSLPVGGDGGGAEA